MRAGISFRLLSLLAALICVGITAPASAQPPLSVNSCGTIVKGGFYEVDSDLTLPTPGDCIAIKAANVTLNLNTHPISGGGGGVGVHVLPTANNTFIEGRGSTIGKFAEGIEIDASNAFAEYFTASANGDAGVYLKNTKQTRVSNFSSESNLDGVRIFGGTMNAVQDVTIQHNQRYGIWLKATSRNTIGGFYLLDNAIAGIYLGCWSTGPQGMRCKPAVAGSNYNSIFNGSAFSGSGGEVDGIAIDLGDNFNKVADVEAEYHPHEDAVDENADCAGNLWVAIKYARSNQSSEGPGQSSSCIP